MPERRRTHISIGSVLAIARIALQRSKANVLFVDISTSVNIHASSSAMAWHLSKDENASNMQYKIVNLHHSAERLVIMMA